MGLRYLQLFCACWVATSGAWGQSANWLHLRAKPGVPVTLDQIAKFLPASHSPTRIRKVFPNQPDSSKLGRWVEVQFTSDKVAKSALPMLQAYKLAEIAELPAAPTIQFIPNDAQYSAQQAYLASIHAPEAWDSCQGDTSVVIGIIDTGFDLDHPDLAANLFINHKEPINGVDDDKDGYIDNRFGIDLIGADYQKQQPDNDPTASGPGGASHGVHVSGIAAAVTNNGIGVAGVGFKCKYLPIKACSDNSTTLYGAYAGIVYAADHGATIINCSFAQNDYNALAADAVAYCIQKGCIVVAGAGNFNSTGPVYPANFPGVVSVASCEVDGTKSSFSAAGAYVGIMAPGSGITSTEYNDAYGARSGTSMAAPIVSGAAALIKAKHKNETAEQIVARLYATADTAVLRLPGNGGYATSLGAGRVNIARALAYRGPGFRVTRFVATTVAGKPLTGNDDSVRFSFTFKNWLFKASPKATVKINNIFALTDPNISISLANLGPLGEVKGSFTAKVPAGFSDNGSVAFRFTFRDSGYVYGENRILILGITTLNWQGPNYTTTSTSNGLIGYLNYITQGAGVGIRYQNESFLYEGGFLFAMGGDTAFSSIRGNQGTQDRDFRRQGRVQALENAKWCKTESFFTDSGSSRPIGLRVRLLSGCGPSSADSNIILYQSTLYNTSATPMRQAYWGFYGDWDLSGGGFNDYGGFVPDYTMPFMTGKQKGYPFYGLVPLTTLAAGGASLNNYGNPATMQPNINDGFTRQEKSLLLRSGVQFASQIPWPKTGDGALLTSQGPFAISAGDSAVVAHAVVFALDSATLVARAIAARKLYGIVTKTAKHTLTLASWSLFPNPASQDVSIEIPSAAEVTLSDLAGHSILTWHLLAGRHSFSIAGIPPGVYALSGRGLATKRLLIIR